MATANGLVSAEIRDFVESLVSPRPASPERDDESPPPKQVACEDNSASDWSDKADFSDESESDVSEEQGKNMSKRQNKKMSKKYKKPSKKQYKKVSKKRGKRVSKKQEKNVSKNTDTYDTEDEDSDVPRRKTKRKKAPIEEPSAKRKTPDHDTCSNNEVISTRVLRSGKTPVGKLPIGKLPTGKLPIPRLRLPLREAYWTAPRKQRKPRVVKQRSDKPPGKHACSICGKSFDKPSHVHRHRKQMHGIEPPPKPPPQKSDHQCNVCYNYYSTSCHLRRHQKNVHNIEPVYKWAKHKDPATRTHKCGTCEKNFSSACHLRRHEKKIHNIEPEYVRKKSLKCAECTSAFPSHRTFAEHVKEQHPDINLQTDNLTFTSEADFEKWKEGMEKETAAMYIKTHRYKTSTTCEIRDYNCHRSGYYRGEGKGKRRIKSCGSNKIGYYCPARLRTKTGKTADDGIKIEVTFHSTHIGHDCDASRLRLSKPEKEVIAEQLKSGKPIQQVIQAICAPAPPEKRLAITKPQDLRNIAASYGIDRNLFKMQREKKKKKKKSTTEQDFLMVLMNDEPEENFDNGYEDNDVPPSPATSEATLKEEARSAILAFLPELDKYTTEQQYKEIIHTLCVLKHKCEAMEASTRYVSPPTTSSFMPLPTTGLPTTTSYMSLPTTASYASPPTTTSYVTPPTTTSYIPPPAPTRYVTPIAASRYVAPVAPMRYVAPMMPTRYVAPSPPNRYPTSPPTRYAPPATSARYVNPPSCFPPCSNYNITPL